MLRVDGARGETGPLDVISCVVRARTKNVANIWRHGLQSERVVQTAAHQAVDKDPE